MENEIEGSYYYYSNNYTSLASLAFFDVHPNITTAILSFIAIIGVIGNFFVLMILAQNHQTQKANILIGGLALADLLYLSLCVPIQIHLHRNHHLWHHGETLCRLNNCLPIALQTAAIYSLVALSANRFNTVVKLTPTSKGCLGGNVYLQVVVVWTASGLTSLSGIFGSNLNERYEGFTICSFMHFEDANLNFIYTFASFIILFAFPLVIIFVYYSRLAWHLYRSIQTLPDDGYLARHNQIIARRRLAVVVLALVVMFVVCWLPYHIAQLLTALFRYSHKNVDPNIIRGIMYVLEPLTYAKSALNPLVLFTMSSFFRQRLKTICRCRKPRKQPTYTCMNSKHAASQRTRYTAVSSPL